MAWDLKYGKHVELKPDTDIPALFHIDELVYVFSFKEHIQNVRSFMKYLYINRRREWKYDRNRSFPLLMDIIKRKPYINTHLVIRLVEWQYIDNDGFWLRNTGPQLKDAIFISIAVRDYLKKHKKVQNPQ